MKVRDELVSFGAPGELRVDEHGVVGGGTHLDPDALDALVAERGDDVVFFDGRNAFEAAIGHFANAVVPDVATTHDFVAELDSGKYDDLKGRPVVTYCTGGIRCEVLSSLMVSRGFGEVYQLDGGIVRYGEARGDDGLWEGSLYVFDKRGSVDFSDHAAVIGHCVVDGTATKRMQNCTDPSCREQLVVCADCAEPAVLRRTQPHPPPADRAPTTHPPTPAALVSRSRRAHPDRATGLRRSAAASTSGAPPRVRAGRAARQRQQDEDVERQRDAASCAA